VKLDFIPASTRAAGLGAMMKGAGKVTRFIPIPQPTLLVGPGASGRLGQAVAGFGHVQDPRRHRRRDRQLGLLKDLTDALTAGGAVTSCSTRSRPTRLSPHRESGIAFYREHDCDAIVAVGGGSSIDASKAIAVSIANPKQVLRSLAGYFKGLNTPVPVYAVPTTAGTGSR
jgi:alcohol dehydrogenase